MSDVPPPDPEVMKNCIVNTGDLLIFQFNVDFSSNDPAIDRTLEELRTNMHNAELDAYDVLSGTQMQQALQMVKEARTNAALTVGRDKSPP